MRAATGSLLPVRSSWTIGFPLMVARYTRRVGASSWYASPQRRGGRYEMPPKPAGMSARCATSFRRQMTRWSPFARTEAMLALKG
jgi:hypothetical protein